MLSSAPLRTISGLSTQLYWFHRWEIEDTENMVTWSRILGWHGTVLQEHTNSQISWPPRKVSFPPCHSLMKAFGLQVATQGSGRSVWCSESRARTCLRSLLPPAICQSLLTCSLQALPGSQCGKYAVRRECPHGLLCWAHVPVTRTGIWTQVLYLRPKPMFSIILLHSFPVYAATLWAEDFPGTNMWFKTTSCFQLSPIK